MNHKSKYSDLNCNLCSSHEDSQEESVVCPRIRGELDPNEDYMKKYMKVFDEDIPEETIELILRILKIRDQ